MGVKGAVVFLVVAVGGILLQTEAASVQPNFQQDQFTGPWYSIAMASNSRWFKDKKAMMKMCITRVTSLEDGNLDVTSTYPTHGQCETRKSLFIRASQPGHFKYTSQRSGNLFEVSVVETDYDRYALLTSKKTTGAESSVMVMLYGRSKELPAEYLEKFTQLCLAEGLTQDEILFLPTTDLCMEDVV